MINTRKPDVSGIDHLREFFPKYKCGTDET